jgi:hypothetical protein
MIHILPSFAAALVACTPSPQESAMHDPIHDPRTTKEPAPVLPADSLQEAQGRRILSTVFVRVGPDGLLTVELHSGRALVLRGVAMHRKDYCGVQVLRGHAGAQYCGKYSEVAAARPGGPPAPAEPDLAAPNQVPR